MVVWIINLAEICYRLSNLFTWNISGLFNFGKNSGQRYNLGVIIYFSKSVTYFMFALEK